MYRTVSPVPTKRENKEFKSPFEEKGSNLFDILERSLEDNFDIRFVVTIDDSVTESLPEGFRFWVGRRHWQTFNDFSSWPGRILKSLIFFQNLSINSSRIIFLQKKKITSHCKNG